MKKIFATLALACLCALAFADNVVPGVSVTGVRTERHGNYLSVRMELELADVEVPSNRAVLVTPFLVNGDDRVVLPSVAVYGRRRYYYYHRKDAGAMLSGPDETTILAKEKPESLPYRELVPYESWMDGASLFLHRKEYGCCDEVLGEGLGEIGRYHEAFFPELVYIRPSGQTEKRRTLEGRAFIDFPVDQTVIYPDYRRNSEELKAIRETIDAVRNDRDATIDTVWLKGFASPESPYSHNRDLAIGRTNALKAHIQQLYHFDGVQMITDYEAEDWDGLRGFVDGSDLPHRAEILAIIDGPLEPDAKEWKIKSTYPSDYRFMLDTFYPALRHTDYRVSYVIRTFSDPEEIMSVIRAQPQKLDQNEFYVAASVLDPGSADFTEVFETAVRMFPDDEIANLNAANAAMRRGDNVGAARYLRKAGDSPEAVYARGALAIRTEDYESARHYLRAAADAGLEQAAATLAEMEERLR